MIDLSGFSETKNSAIFNILNAVTNKKYGNEKFSIINVEISNTLIEPRSRRIKEIIYNITLKSKKRDLEISYSIFIMQGGEIFVEENEIYLLSGFKGM